MRIRYRFLFTLLINASQSLAQHPIDSMALSVLAIGNAHYNSHQKIFASNNGIDTSAERFLNSFKHIGALTCIMQSTEMKPLTKQNIITATESFVDFAANRCKNNIGIIYYCGHGQANKSGSMYWIPGNITAPVTDTTFTYLQEVLINIDEIVSQVIAAQAKSINESTFYILSDCCSDEISSKFYKGISYNQLESGYITITYDSTFLKSLPGNSSLEKSMSITFNQIDPDTSRHDTSKNVNINEAGFISEVIRTMTFQSSGNAIFYSSQLGETTLMVPAPTSASSSPDIGPLCRRSLLYFQATKEFNLQSYFNTLVEKDFDRLTSPIVFNRSRNIKHDK
jgi:hypothetical protein